MQKVVVHFALIIGLVLLATTPVVAEEALAPVTQAVTETQTLTETQSLTETQTTTEAIPVEVEVETTEATTDTVAAPADAAPAEGEAAAAEGEAAPAEAAPAEAAPAEVVVAAPVTGASMPPQLQYGLWLVAAAVLFGVGFWLQRRSASANRGR